ncbi:hypothetical protein AJ79_07538 [Helicocarpus griseus UAMH5409]|uniref:DUF1996 domain-containing protein n=1 Tax=Helicocarpus griseus UAMH5409 TaxID=1447875 RepID=A0A2B7X1U5_9EURO|nr:hypothetical protein AJ79_07538 [Helicocarpus griseus UAMH5409]
MKWPLLPVIALLAPQHVTAQMMLRFACSQLVVERTDPLVEPGENPSSHLHQIVGGNSFNITMTPVEHDLATESTCTSCSFPQDRSNYWTAILFFKRADGKFKRVPQVANSGLHNKGGMDVYYIPSGTVTSFPPGFRMLAGDAMATNPPTSAQGNICFRCWNAPNENTFVGGAPCTGQDTVDIPNSRDCYFLRQTIIFPACWDGVNLDSPNHQDHVAYSGVGATGGGPCPASHPVKVPQVMYEIMWDVREFQADQSMWPTDGSNPYILSNNMGGSAAHGDYVFGWEGDILQRAMDNRCNLNMACPAAGLITQSEAEYDACTVPQQAEEAVDGWLDELPGYAGV